MDKERKLKAGDHVAWPWLSGIAEGKVKEISPDLYRFDFQPPLWSPDLAGFAVLTTIILGSILLFRGLFAVIKKAL